MSKKSIELKIALVGLLGLLVLGAFFLFPVFVLGKSRSSILASPLFRLGTSFFRSARKFPDVVFFPYLMQKTNLPVYELRLTVPKMALLESRLPDPFSGRLEAENRTEVNAEFRAGDFYQPKVKVRYRGFGPDHWNAIKKSWRITFVDKEGLGGMKSLDLIIPNDRGYFVEPLVVYRAKKLGLNASEFRFVRLRLNGKDMGVYLASEGRSKKWLSRLGLPDNSSIFTVDESRISEIAYSDGPYLVPERLSYWSNSSREGKKQDVKPEDFAPLAALAEVVNKADDHTFKKIIPHLVDLPKFYAWDILRMLSGSNHQSDNYNLVLLFNIDRGKFEILPADVNMLDQNEIVYTDDDMLLSKRIFSVPEFREARNAVLRKYLTEENLKDDLAFYDRLDKDFRAEFLSDTVKIDNDFTFLSRVREYRDLIVDNFKRASAFLDFQYDFKMPVQSTAYQWLKGFERLPELALSKEEFLAKHPEFKGLEGNLISIGPGTQILQQTVILPSGFRLMIQPGTTLLMGKNVSLISYSPIEARGLVEEKIQIKALDPNQTWGSILIVDAPQKSVISWADITGGSGVNLEGVGIKATGMLAAHFSDLEFSNSSIHHTVYNDINDDGLNVKGAIATIRHSLFYDTYSDAIDFDAVKSGSLIEGNTFMPPIGEGNKDAAGDAIDISFSQVKIADNNIQGGCGDKGISVGENSHPLIVNNVIKGCPIGIASKDLSRARIFHNKLVGNKVAISAYQKKLEFGGGSAVVIDSLFEGNQVKIKTDSFSRVEIIK